MYASNMQSFPKNPYAVRQRKWKNEAQEIYEQPEVEEVESDVSDVEDNSHISTLSLVGTIVGLSALVIGTTFLLKNKNTIRGTESLGETSASEDDNADDKISNVWKNSMAKFKTKLQQRLPVEEVEEEEEVVGAQPTYVEERTTKVKPSKKGKNIKKTTHIKERPLVPEVDTVQKPKKSKFKTMFA